MRFFERQEEVRRKTLRLALLFGVAVVGVVWAVNRLLFLLLLLPEQEGPRDPSRPRLAPPTTMQVLFACDPGVSVYVLAGIAAGYFWTRSRVRRGGPAVAEWVGARPLAADTADPAEQRLQNVMEEMAIASGIPAPSAYVLDAEEAINAFAAGHSTEDSVVAVTSGALEKLDRDELQAVVAHEYSHVLNGDSRINLQMICLVGGLTGVKRAGSFIRTTAWKGAGALAILTVFFSAARFVGGLALEIVGWFGVLGGRVVKAAVSRQREFLADAYAVQFTRNPVALVRALRKMAADPASSAHAHLDEVSHMFFVQAVRESLGSLFDTHPPIEERLAAIEGAGGGPVRPPVAATSTGAGPTPKAAVASLGELGPVHMEYARRLHGRIPGPVLQSARTPSAARGVIGGVLLHADSEVREAQMTILGSLRALDVAEAALAAADCLRADPEALRLPLVELAMPGLGRLRPEDKEMFLEAVRALVGADRKRTLFEFAVLALLQATLRPRPSDADRVRFTSLAQVKPEADQVRRLLAPGTGPAGSDEVDDRVLPALAKLRALSPAAKRELLAGLSAAAAADGAVSFGEAEVLRAVSAAIGCPLPPLVAQPERGLLVSEA
jgi:Zn-dependent protease with chaperone function